MLPRFTSALIVAMLTVGTASPAYGMQGWTVVTQVRVGDLTVVIPEASLNEGESHEPQ